MTIQLAQGGTLQLALPPATSARDSVPQEIILDGRRYMLTPVIEREASPSKTRADEAEIEAQSARIRGLSVRERGIVELVARGYVNKQIAGELRISEHTVSTHMRRIFAKLGVDTRAAMVSCYLSARGEAR